MKKLIAVFMCLILIIPFSSCAQKTDAVNMNRLYSVTADVKLGNLNSTVDLNRLGNGAWDMNFTKPESLKGIAVSYENDKAKLTYNGLSYSMERDNIPVSAIASNLSKILDKAALGTDMIYTKDNGKITAKGSIDNGSFEIVFDANTACPIELKLAKINLDVKFSDFKPMA